MELSGIELSGMELSGEEARPIELRGIELSGTDAALPELVPVDPSTFVLGTAEDGMDSTPATVGEPVASEAVIGGLQEFAAVPCVTRQFAGPVPVVAFRTLTTSWSAGLMTQPLVP